MWKCSFVSASCFLVFFLVTPTIPFIEALSVDPINTTCKQCASKSIIFDYSFCLTSLQTVPVSHVTDVPGLAIIAMELALGNATATISTIESMLSGGAFDPFARQCLLDCLELYSDAVSVLEQSAAAFLEGQFDTANLLMSAVMEAAVTCEVGFSEKEGEVTPLTEENYDLFELSDIALCIINLLSLGLPSVIS
ncbi:hypothetical protein RJ639_006431 [Escallonia herrerae]|uniref:Pectinesterase inhibitor domain-containing protein n=1 Tax=Escallonia herrerae TaxID=1293975 RepID=A0AA88VZ91_9ASTE|nr:hypothetical protein RJ639_006431 [Escallonia herrerae]